MRKHLLFVLFSISSILVFTPLVIHAQWEPDRRLTFKDSSSWTSDNNAWSIAAAGDTVHIVWSDYRDNRYSEIYYKRSIDGGVNWDLDRRLTCDTTPSGSPSVAVSGMDVHVAWEDWRDDYWGEIYYKRSIDGGATWCPDTRLSYGRDRSWHSCIAVAGPNVHVVWLDQRDLYHQIYYTRSTDEGVTWEPENRLTNTNSSNYLKPSIAVSGSKVHVVWDDTKLFYKRSTDGGATWGPDTAIVNGPSFSAQPSIALSGANVHVTWWDYRDRNVEMYYKKSTDEGLTWGSDIRLTNDTASSESPSIASSGSNVHLVWFDQRDGNYELYYKRSTDSGTTWSLDTRLTNDSAYSRNPSVVVSGPVVHLLWMDNRDKPGRYLFEIYYKRNPTGNSGVEEFEVPSPVRSLPFSVRPNPFTSFATVPGHSSDQFALYDISGRRVGTYRGDRIGEGLAAGVYFIRAESGKGKPVRIVKVR
jgi:hypothetical protein